MILNDWKINKKKPIDLHISGYNQKLFHKIKIIIIIKLIIKMSTYVYCNYNILIYYLLTHFIEREE